MSQVLNEEVRELLAAYVELPPAEFRMDADLDLTYDMDSTELTELAKKIEQRFGVRASKSERQDWSTGEHICRFLQRRQADAAASA